MTLPARFLPIPALISLLALPAALPVVGAPPPQQTPSPASRKAPEISPSALQRLRQLLGLGRPTAVGGSRSDAGEAICVLTPVTTGLGQGDVAKTPLATPTILAIDPLNEVRIEAGGQMVWQRLASSKAPIEGPIPWPIAAIRPEQTVLIRLRPRGANGGDFATLQLRGAPAAEMASATALLQSLGPEESQWMAAIEQQLRQGNRALAWELLFSPQAPPRGAIGKLRDQIVRQGCGP
jgi:hypothetical protein